MSLGGGETHLKEREELLLGISRRSGLDTHLQLNDIDEEEGDDADSTAEDHGEDAVQEATLAQDLPEDEACGTGDNGPDTCSLGGLLNHQT